MTPHQTPQLIAELLQPIRPDAPAGDSLRYTPVYDAIVTARTADAGLPQGEWQRPEKRADWPLVERLCTDALIRRSKDLQIAAWLSEAWLQLHALDGLIVSLRLLLALHEEFMTTMYPVDTPGEPLTTDVIEHRANLIQAFSERTGMALKFVPLCAPEERDLQPGYTLADLEQAKFKEQVQRRSQDRSYEQDDSTIPFERSDESTPPAFYYALQAQIVAAQAEAARLDEMLDQAYGRANGGLGQITKVLHAMELHLTPRAPAVLTPSSTFEDDIDSSVISEPEGERTFAGIRKLFSKEAHGVGEVGYDREEISLDKYEIPDSEERSVSSHGLPTAYRGVTTRAEAYERIREAAEFLSRTEPHSPVPYLLRRALRWGSLSLQELLPELVHSSEGLDKE